MVAPRNAIPGCRAVSYEALSKFVPEFGHALREAESMVGDMAAESPSDYIGHLSDAAEHLPS
jgi:hypothetical protein